MPSTEPSCSTITWPMTVGHSIQTNDAKLLKRSKQIQISVTACGSWFWMLIYQLSKSTGNIERHWGAAKHKAEVDKRQEERHYTVEAREAQHRRGRRDTAQETQERHYPLCTGTWPCLALPPGGVIDSSTYTRFFKMDQSHILIFLPNQRERGEIKTCSIWQRDQPTIIWRRWQISDGLFCFAGAMRLPSFFLSLMMMDDDGDGDGIDHDGGKNSDSTLARLETWVSSNIWHIELQ